jgi:hypothetical protein
VTIASSFSLALFMSSYLLILLIVLFLVWCLICFMVHFWCQRQNFRLLVVLFLVWWLICFTAHFLCQRGKRKLNKEYNVFDVRGYWFV